MFTLRGSPTSHLRRDWVSQSLGLATEPINFIKPRLQGRGLFFLNVALFLGFTIKLVCGVPALHAERSFEVFSETDYDDGC